MLYCFYLYKGDREATAKVPDRLLISFRTCLSWSVTTPDHSTTGLDGVDVNGNPEKAHVSFKWFDYYQSLLAYDCVFACF